MAAPKSKLGLTALEARDNPSVYWAWEPWSAPDGQYFSGWQLVIEGCQYANIVPTWYGVQVTTNHEIVPIPGWQMDYAYILFWGTEGNDYVNNNTHYSLRAFMNGGNDFAWGGPRMDELHGGAGNDTVRGYDGDDWLYGDGGNDRVMGERGSDRVFGGTEDDVLEGGVGTDWLYGEAGRDVLHGAGVGWYDDYGSPDFLNGGVGADWFYGSTGRDVFTGTRDVDVSWGWDWWTVRIEYDQVDYFSAWDGDWRD